MLPLSAAQTAASVVSSTWYGPLQAGSSLSSFQGLISTWSPGLQGCTGNLRGGVWANKSCCLGRCEELPDRCCACSGLFPRCRDTFTVWSLPVWGPPSSPDTRRLPQQGSRTWLLLVCGGCRGTHPNGLEILDEPPIVGRI